MSNHERKLKLLGSLYGASLVTVMDQIATVHDEVVILVQNKDQAKAIAEEISQRASRIFSPAFDSPFQGTGRRETWRELTYCFPIPKSPDSRAFRQIFQNATSDYSQIEMRVLADLMKSACPVEGCELNLLHEGPHRKIGDADEEG